MGNPLKRKQFRKLQGVRGEETPIVIEEIKEEVKEEKNEVVFSEVFVEQEESLEIKEDESKKSKKKKSLQSD